MERNNADRRDGGVAADLARAYNDVWYDRGTHVAIVNGAARTSLIVDPPDGRIPALTPDAQRRAGGRAAGAARSSRRRSRGSFARPNAAWRFNAGPPMLPGPYNNYMQVLQSRTTWSSSTR